jgi:hypothetical protein
MNLGQLFQIRKKPLTLMGVMLITLIGITSNVTAQEEHIPGDISGENLSRIVSDTIIHNDTGNANLNNWEPYTSVLGNEVFLIEANTFAEGSTENQRYTVTLQPADGGPPVLGEAFYTDAGEPFTGQINGSRQNGNPGRVAGDKRPGATNFITGGEASPHLFSGFKSDNRWSLGFDRLGDGRYGTVQSFSFDAASGVQTPNSTAFDAVTGRITSGAGPSSQISRFGGDLAGLSNGNFLAVVEDRSDAINAGTSAVGVIFEPNGTIVKDSFLVSPGSIWSNVTAFKDGFCVRASATLFFYDNEGNLMGESAQDTALDSSGAPIIFNGGRGDGTRIASHINSPYVYLAGSTGIDVFIAAWDSRTQSFVGHSNVNELVAEFGGTGSDLVTFTADDVDRVGLAVDALDRIAVAFGSQPANFQNKQILCRVMAFNESDNTFSHLTATFLAFDNQAPDGGILTERPNVSMTTKAILIAGKGSVNTGNNPGAGADTPPQTTVYTVFSHPDPQEDPTPAVAGSSGGGDVSFNSANGWTIVADEDTDSVFGFDYSALGIPAAPNGSDTLGLRLRSNITSDGPGAAAISASPDSIQLSGQYTVEFDFWINIAWAGSTEAAGGAVGYDASAGSPLNGTQLIVNSDGDSSSDIQLRSGGDLLGLDTGFYNIASLNNANAPAVQAAFPGQSAPALQIEQLGQVGTTAQDGTFAFGWHTMKIDGDADAGTATFSIDGFTFGTVTGVDVSGGIAVTHWDPFNSVNGIAELAFGIYDNLVISSGGSTVPTAPTFEMEGPIVLNAEELFTNGANMAINTHEPEVLFTTLETLNANGQFMDPITGEVSNTSVIGFFYNPITLEPTSDPFIIVGNPDGNIETHDLKYSPVSGQYVVVASATNYRPLSQQTPIISLVNPQSVDGDRVAKSFAYEADGDQSFDDVAVAVSTQNGNILLTAERNFPTADGGSREGVMAALFDQDGNLLTSEFGRMDQLQPDGDEDDPDIVYLENNDVFLVHFNTDGDDFQNVITGSIVQTVPDANGNMQIGTQQILGADRKDGDRQGHSAALENPFNDDLIGVFDYGNGSNGGDIFYFKIGAAPEYILKETNEQIPYLEAEGNDTYNHRHPQLAADRNSGVIAIIYNAKNSGSGLPNGIAITFLGPDGNILPGIDSDAGLVSHGLLETIDPFMDSTTIDNDANNYNIKYDPVSDSFIGVYADSSSFTYAFRVKVNSTHISPPSSTPAELSITSSDGSISVGWDGNGSLQASSEVEGVYTNVDGATSPYTTTADQSRSFFRVVD